MELEGFEGRFGGGALCGFFGATTTAGYFLVFNRNGAGVMAVVVGAVGVELAIVRGASVVMPLGEFLEPGLGVARLPRVGLLEGFRKERGDDALGGIQSTVEVNCADECFEGVLQHGVAGFGVMIALRLADAQGLGEMHAARDGCEGAAIDNAGAHAVEGALVRLGELREELRGDEEVEDGIAEEFEALVIAGGKGKAGMGEGAMEAFRILKGIAEAFLKLVERVGHCEICASKGFPACAGRTVQHRAKLYKTRPESMPGQ